MSFGQFAPPGFTAQNSSSTSAPQLRVGTIQHDIAGIAVDANAEVITRFEAAFNAANPDEEAVWDDLTTLLL